MLKGDVPHLGGFIIHIPNSEKAEAIKMLKRIGIEDITQVRESRYSGSFDIYGAWRIIRGLIEDGYIDKNNHNFILSPKKQKQECFTNECKLF